MCMVREISDFLRIMLGLGCERGTGPKAPDFVKKLLGYPERRILDAGGEFTYSD